MSTRKVQRASRIVLTLTLFSPFTGMAPDAMQPQAAIARNLLAEPTGEQVLERYIEATGGRAAYEKVTSRVTTGKFSVPAQGLNAEMVSYSKAPNLTYMTIDLTGMGKIERGYYGEIEWEKNPQTGTRIVEGEEKVQFEQQARLNSELAFQGYPATFPMARRMPCGTCPASTVTRLPTAPL